MFSRVLRKFTSETLSSTSPFSAYKFPASVETLLKNQNITQPSEIQQAAWPVIESGKDLVAIAKTGSGKTLGYLLPMVKHIIQKNSQKMILSKNQPPNSLIILPTRELTNQVAAETLKFCAPVGIKHASIFGGVPKFEQKFFLTRGVHTVIGTPGRIADFLSDGILVLDQVDYLVLDEADMMLDMGFENLVRAIISNLPNHKQTLMFTATWPKEIALLASDLLNKPEKIQIGSSELSMNEDIKHRFIHYEKEDKLHQLNALMSEEPDKKYLIFANTKKMTEHLKIFLINNNLKAESLNSDKDQRERNYAMKSFTSGNANILIATDVASRGLDIKGIDFVVNFDIPNNLDDFIHRVGRTGRAGNKGVAVSFYGNDSRKIVMKGIMNKLAEIKQQVPHHFKQFAFDRND